MTMVDPTLARRLAQLDKALRLMGGTHSVGDILAAIKTGQMQSFARGESWVVTQVFDFPQKRVLEIFLAMGDLPDLLALHDIIEAFARAQKCQLIRAIGRPGWMVFCHENDWKFGSRVFIKELE